MTEGFVSCTLRVHPADWDEPAAEVDTNGDGTAFVRFARGLGHDGSNPEQMTSGDLRSLAEGLVEVADLMDDEERRHKQ